MVSSLVCVILGSISKLRSKCVLSMLLWISLLKDAIASGLLVRIFTYFCLNGFNLRTSTHVKQGKWSDILVIIIPDRVGAAAPEDLQNIWSIRVPLFFENRVGSVIWGKKPLLAKRSKYSCIFSESLICRRFRLKSPDQIRVEFSLLILVIIFGMGVRKFSIQAIELLRPGL